jgi:hypothetical protein
MNSYKQAWYANTLVATTEAPKPERIRKVLRRNLTKKAQQNTDGVGRLARETGLTLANEIAHRASKSAMTGSIGTAVRMGGRVGVRVIPVVGYAMLAYDVYQFGKWVHEKI